MINPENIHSSTPKLIIDPNVSVKTLRARTQEEQEFLELQKELGTQGVIDLAISLSPGRDFSENPLQTAKDVICGIYANGGQETMFAFANVEPPAGPTETEQDRISIDY